MRKILLILMTFSLFGFTLIGNKGTVSPTYLLSEGFEGTGYENTGWSESGTGAVNEDYATNCFQGAQCLLMDVSGINSVTTQYLNTLADEAWYYFTLHLLTYSNVASANSFIEIRSPIGAIMELRIVNGIWYLTSGTVQVSYNGITPTQGSTYHIWLRYKKGTGMNAEGDFWICDHALCAGEKPISPSASFSTGQTTTQARYLSLRSVIAAHDFIFDKVRIDDVNIGSNPQ